MIHSPCSTTSVNSAAFLGHGSFHSAQCLFGDPVAAYRSFLPSVAMLNRFVKNSRGDVLLVDGDLRDGVVEGLLGNRALGLQHHQGEAVHVDDDVGAGCWRLSLSTGA